MVGSVYVGVCTDQTDLANSKVLGKGYDVKGRNNEGWGSNLG